MQRIVFSIAIFFFAIFFFAISSASAHDVAKEMFNAAELFISSLNDEQKQQLQFEFDDALRKDWQFIPMERQGLGLKAMKPHQRGLALAFAQTGLSHHGFSTAMQVMALEQVLHEMENGNAKRDPAKYHLFLFGKPELGGVWGWRIEGHHLSISFTVTGEEVSVVPTFFGTNPGEVKQGPMKGLRVLAREEDLGRKLIRNLSVDQKAKAILPGDVPSDVITGPGREAQPLTPMGIPAAEMTEEQKKVLQNLINVYTNKVRWQLAQSDRKRIAAAGFDKIHFAWSGKIQPGSPHYYRIQGPTFIMEYDNTQNDANHVHVVWRDFKNDFGADLLRQHYEKTAKAAATK